MHSSRREFLQTSVAAGVGVAVGASVFAGHQEEKKTAASPSAKGAPLKILILGGTGFLGPAIVTAARAKGHTVTLFNRGRTRPGLFKDIEQLHGDRDPKKTAVIKSEDGKEQIFEGIKSLDGQKWDVVFDDSGYYPRHVKASAELLSPNIKQYVFVSSVSAYADPSKPGDDATAALAVLSDPTVETMGDRFQNYGGLKVLCEKAVQEACPGKATIIRPGFIVGPDDPTGRFTYWPVRFDRGGHVVVPGTPNDPMQIIDVRDLAEWMVLMAEKGTMGTFDALGPDKGALKWGAVIDACSKQTTTKHDVTWIPLSFVEEQHLSPGGDFPIWVPPSGESEGFHQRNVSKSIEAGLKFRPISTTCKDTLEWWKTLDVKDHRRQLGGLDAAKEEKVWEAFTGASKPEEKPAEKPAEKPGDK